MDFSIDLDQFSRMTIDRRVTFLEGALMFKAVPPENVSWVKRYIETHKAYIVNKKQNKHKVVIIAGGIHRLANAITENFPHIVQLSNNTFSNQLEEFVSVHEIVNDDYIACGGRASDYSKFNLICFRHSSDAVLAKLYFKDSKLLERSDLESIELKAIENTGGFDDEDEDDDDDEDDGSGRGSTISYKVTT